MASSAGRLLVACLAFVAPPVSIKVVRALLGSKKTFAAWRPANRSLVPGMRSRVRGRPLRRRNLAVRMPHHRMQCEQLLGQVQ